MNGNGSFINSKASLKPLRFESQESDVRLDNNQEGIDKDEVRRNLKICNKDSFKGIPTPNFNSYNNSERKFPKKKLSKFSKKLRLKKQDIQRENNSKINNSLNSRGKKVFHNFYLEEEKSIYSTSSISERVSEMRAQSRYKKQPEKQDNFAEKSSVKFDGFRDDDDIIINPEFGQSLKASLKASKRRLMLFIDNNEEANPVESKPNYDPSNDQMEVYYQSNQLFHYC